MFALALSLDSLQLVHGAIKLPVPVSLIAEDFVSYIRGRQAEATSLPRLVRGSPADEVVKLFHGLFAIPGRNDGLPCEESMFNRVAGYDAFSPGPPTAVLALGSSEEEELMMS